MASFLVISNSGEQKLVSSEKNLLRIGRLADSEILVDDPVTSRRQAELFRTDGRCYVRDTGSRNGTMVNGIRIAQPTELFPGDVIGVGTAKIVYEPSEGTCLLKEMAVPEPILSVSLSTRLLSEQMTATHEFLEIGAEIARQLVEDKPLERLLDSILTTCAEKTAAERVAIMLLDQNGQPVPRAYLSKAKLGSSFALSRTIVQKAIVENRGILIKDVAGDTCLDTSESIVSLKIRSAICTPLWSGEKAIGVLYLDTIAPDRQFGENDLLFFSTLSGMIAEKIENSILADIAKEKKRLDVELGIAVDIQSRLLPMAIPTIAGYDLTAFNHPCTEMGGDYFDVIVAGNRYVLVIADVTGKGIGAAMLMSNLQAMVHSMLTDNLDPSVILGKINADLSSRIGDGMFITCCYLTLAPEGGDILYANAGHNQPLICRNNGDITELDVSGIPLGIMGDSAYETFSTGIEPGEVLLLYTDGITESANREGELFGTERLKGVVASAITEDAAAIRTAVCAAVENFRDGQPQADDMTFVVVRRRETIS